MGLFQNIAIGLGGLALGGLLSGLFGRGQVQTIPVQPQRSPEEMALIQQQLALAELQQQLLEQAVAQRAEIEDELIRTLLPTPEMMEKQKEINRLIAERTLAALEGKLDVDPRLTREIEEARQSLEESAAAELGPNYQFSEPYIRRKDALERRINDVLEAARRGLIQTNEAIAATRAETDINRSRVLSALMQSQFLGPSAITDALTGLSRGISAIRQYPMQVVQWPGTNFLGPVANLAGTLIGANVFGGQQPFYPVPVFPTFGRGRGGYRIIDFTQ